MIHAEQGETHAEGKLFEIVYEFDEIMRLMILNNPEIVQAVCCLRGKDILNQDVDPRKYVIVEDMLRRKKEMEESGEYDD